jgi:molybdate transport system substrate-binding protein
MIEEHRGLRSVFRIVLALLLVCAGPLSAGAQETDRAILVAGAASLQPVLKRIGRAFQRKARTEVTITLGSSGNLRRQVESGAPIDVLITAQAGMLDEMAREGRVTGHRDIATNTLVVVVPASSKRKPPSPEGLTAPEIKRIGIGQPDYVPAGAYAKSALEKAGLYEKVKTKLVYGEDVRQVLAYVARGEVDAAFVYRTDARAFKDVAVAFELPKPKDRPITYAAGVTSQAADPALARAFVDFMAREAQFILRENGFGPPPPPGR